jgi:acyl carrier protein
LAEADGVVCTSRLSVRTHPWLADHSVGGTVLLPGTAFVELATAAGRRLGCECLADLTVEAPLTLTTEPVRVQVVVGEAGETGSRSVRVYARSDDATEWTRYASGTLVSELADDAPASLTEWPPHDAELVDVTDHYADLAAAGFDYGPTFRGLHTAWRRDDEIFAEVALPESVMVDGFGVHPALLDAALQAIALTTAVSDTDSGRIPLPFAWSGLTISATGTSKLRVRITPTAADTVAVAAFDTDGRPVLYAESLTLRSIAISELGLVRHDSLFRLDWVPVVVSEAESVDSDVTVLPAFGLSVNEVLEFLQGWLADDRPSGSRLVVLTRNAVTDLDGAGVWGLVRSAQSESPGRMVLVDLDDDEWPSERLLAGIVASGEPQVAVRSGQVQAPRLVRHRPATGVGSVWPTDGTVLITGGTGVLGGLVARHLAVGHGVRDLLLVSRSGGAEALVDELSELGARVRVAVCDVSDRGALAELLGSVPVLVGVVHAAGVVDDGVIESLTPERVDRVFAPKLVAARHLDELTRDVPLSMFVVFSSAAGVLGGAGQSGYAAANAALDALVRGRVAAGLPGKSLGWGLWGSRSGLTGALSEVDLARMARVGVLPLGDAEALALFDAACADPEPTLLPMRLSVSALRAQGTALPPLFSALVPKPRQDRAVAAGPGDLLRRLATLDHDEQFAALVDFVRGQVAGVLGFANVTQVEPDRAFKDLGFDSLTAVELRNRLNESTGARLPATLIFDNPTPSALARHLGTVLDLGPENPADAVLDELNRLEATLATLSTDGLARSRIAIRLQTLLSTWNGGWADEQPTDDPAATLDTATDDDLFSLVENLGKS